MAWLTGIQLGMLQGLPATKATTWSGRQRLSAATAVGSAMFQQTDQPVSQLSAATQSESNNETGKSRTELKIRKSGERENQQRNY
jgi:hypothetical protein